MVQSSLSQFFCSLTILLYVNNFLSTNTLIRSQTTYLSNLACSIQILCPTVSIDQDSLQSSSVFTDITEWPKLFWRDALIKSVFFQDVAVEPDFSLLAPAFLQPIKRLLLLSLLPLASPCFSSPSSISVCVDFVRPALWAVESFLWRLALEISM